MLLYPRKYCANGAGHVKRGPDAGTNARPATDHRAVAARGVRYLTGMVRHR